MIEVLSWYAFSLVLAVVNLPLAYAAMKKYALLGNIFAATAGIIAVGTIFWWFTPQSN
jgi:hypothetical protein